MKPYRLIYLVCMWGPISAGFPNEELHNLYKLTVREACYKSGATAGICSFLGTVAGMVLIEYLKAPREGRQPIMSPHAHKF